MIRSRLLLGFKEVTKNVKKKKNQSDWQSWARRWWWGFGSSRRRRWSAGASGRSWRPPSPIRWTRAVPACCSCWAGSAADASRWARPTNNLQQQQQQQQQSNQVQSCENSFKQNEKKECGGTTTSFLGFTMKRNVLAPLQMDHAVMGRIYSIILM